MYSVFMDLTKDDLDNNSKLHHCKSRTCFSNHQHPAHMLRYTKQGNGEGNAEGNAKHSQTLQYMS